MIDQIVFETNNYAQTVINSKRPVRKHSILNKWHPFDAYEMKKFLGLTLHLELTRLLTYQYYWSKKPLFSLPFFRPVMPYKQFQEVLLFWHFGDYSEFTNDRLSKIGLMMKTFNKKCHHILVLITR